MGSAFTRAEYSATPPEVIIAGDYLAFKNTDLVSDYPVASYALTYEASDKGSTKFAITAVETTDPEAYYVEVGGDVTAAYAVGTYQWAAYITDSSDSTKRTQVAYGSWEVKPNLAVSTRTLGLITRLCWMLWKLFSRIVRRRTKPVIRSRVDRLAGWTSMTSCASRRSTPGA